MPNTYIKLPYGGTDNCGFWSDALKRHLLTLGNISFRIGGLNETFSNHPHHTSLDYWLRKWYVRDIDVRQTCDSIKNALLETDDFEIRQVANGLPGVDPEYIILKNTIYG